MDAQKAVAAIGNSIVRPLLSFVSESCVSPNLAACGLFRHIPNHHHIFSFMLKLPHTDVFCVCLLPWASIVSLLQVSVDCLANDSGSTVTLFFLKTLLFAILPFLFSLLAVSLIFLGVFISKRYFDKEINKETRNATLVTANIVFLFSSFTFLPLFSVHSYTAISKCQ